MRMVFFFLLPFVSAMMLSASFAPHDHGILAWFGLAPVLFGLRQKGIRAAAVQSALFGCLFWTITFFWVNDIPGVNLANFFLTIIAFGLYFFLYGALYRLISLHLGPWIIIGAPTLWVAIEYLRANLFFLAWPWNLLGHSQYKFLPVIQVASFTGVYGISFLLLMVNQFISQVPDFFGKQNSVAAGRSTQSSHRLRILLPPATVAIFLAVTFTYDWHRLRRPAGDQFIRVAVVQANAVTEDKMDLARQVAHLRPYKELTGEVAKGKPDLIVWPASSLPAPINSSRAVRLTVKKLARETGAYLLVGGAGGDKGVPKQKGIGPHSNSEYLISPSGRIEGQYDKIRLLPFNEYVPLQGKIRWPQWITALEESYIPGEAYTLFHISGATFGSPICWENLFPDLFRRFVKDGADFMVSVTNESFMGKGPAPYQTLAANIFRAVENGVFIVRSASTGISAIIDSNGRILDRVKDDSGEDLFVPGYLIRDIPLAVDRTFYTVHGDIFAYAAIGVAALLVTIAAMRRSPLFAMRAQYER